MLLTRPPHPALRPFIRQLWAMEPDAGGRPPAGREHVLPTGCMHLALRLSGTGLRLFADNRDRHGEDLGHAVVGGARTRFHVREVDAAVSSAGVQLEPGAAYPLIGVPAGELAGRHTRLQDLWGAPSALLLIEQLAEAPFAQRLDLLEASLWRRLQPQRAVHPGVAQALVQLRRRSTVESAVRASGLSHRQLLTRFRRATGLRPKQYAGLLRLQDVMAESAARPVAAWVELALDAGFADQAHFSRAFHEFAGLPPQAWRRAAPAHSHHVPVA